MFMGRWVHPGREAYFPPWDFLRSAVEQRNAEESSRRQGVGRDTDSVPARTLGEGMAKSVKKKTLLGE